MHMCRWFTYIKYDGHLPRLYDLFVISHRVTDPIPLKSKKTFDVPSHRCFFVFLSLLTSLLNHDGDSEGGFRAERGNTFMGSLHGFPLNEEKTSRFPRIANWFHRDINHLFNIYITTRDRKVLCHPWGGNAQALHARQLSESRQKRAVKQIWLSKHVRRTMFPRHLCSWADREAWQFGLMSWVPILPTLLK